MSRWRSSQPDGRRGSRSATRSPRRATVVGAPRDEGTATVSRMGGRFSRARALPPRRHVSDPRLNAPAAAIRLTATNIRISVIGSWMAPPSAAPAESVS
jgi:hypothetical protein